MHRRRAGVKLIKPLVHPEGSLSRLRLSVSTLPGAWVPSNGLGLRYAKQGGDLVELVDKRHE